MVKLNLLKALDLRDQIVGAIMAGPPLIMQRDGTYTEAWDLMYAKLASLKLLDGVITTL